MKITFDQFIEHWTRGGKAQPFISSFERAIFDFTTLSGEYTRDKFKSSFDSGRFIGVGETWPARTPRWARKARTENVMIDTGTLKHGIEHYQPPMSHSFIVQKPAPGQKAIYRKGSHYLIYTNAKSRAEKGRRGTNPYSNGSYAAIHNTDPKFGLFWSNNRYARRPEHRQFIGFHPIIDNAVRDLIPAIFENFPLH